MGDRDNQRSKCYAWERTASASIGQWNTIGAFDTLEECQAFADPIWRKERGRVGLARHATPSFERPHWGQRRGLAKPDGRITLPRFARNPWYILHEVAHQLNPDGLQSHGPRFVGLLIGLVCRWLDADADALMRMADEHGLKYHVRTIGSVPVHGPAWHLEHALVEHGPGTPMDLACHLSLGRGVDITQRQVRGAALALIRAGRARWYRRKLVLIESSPTTTP